MNTKIITSRIVSDILINKGVEDVVICPGSRNAPLMLSFGHRTEIRKHSIVDERSAGFFALGLSLKTKKPSVLISTSGTAVLNFAPAIAEAYYQKIPLIILTADRPDYLIDQADSQSLRQNNIFANYIQKSYILSHRLQTKNDLIYAERIVNEAYHIANNGSPVHINLPFEEPLYDIIEEDKKSYRIIQSVPSKNVLSPSLIEEFQKSWNKATKKMILIGQGEYDLKWVKTLENSLDDSCILISETLSNLRVSNSISGIDKVLQRIKEKSEFIPEILITTGGAIVSKKIKQFLREAPNFEHWHFQQEEEYLDTYFHLTKMLKVDFAYFIEKVANSKNTSSDYQKLWLKEKQDSEAKHKKYLQSAPWSDLKVYDILFSKIPKESVLHLANSTPVRYAQLFEKATDYLSLSNRGTSGIDGSLSTAIGYASLSDKINTVISGDLSFFYDSNALMKKGISNNLKIVLINNQGGNIFRFIPGPQNSGLLEEFFEAKHNFSAKYISKAFNIPYYSANDESELLDVIGDFYNNPTASIMEIFTDGRVDAEVLKEYFQGLHKPL